MNHVIFSVTNLDLVVPLLLESFDLLLSIFRLLLVLAPNVFQLQTRCDVTSITPVTSRVHAYLRYNAILVFHLLLFRLQVTL